MRNPVLTLFLATLSLLDPPSAYGQEYSWSNLERFRNRTSYNRIVGENEDGYYVIRSKDRNLETKIIIERYRNSLGQDYSKRLPEMKGYRLEEIFVQEDGLLIFKSHFNPFNETIELYCQKYSNESQPLEPPKKVAFALPKSFSDNGDFHLVKNDDGTRFFLSFTQIGPGKKVELFLQVLDEQGNLIQKTRGLMAFDIEEFEREKMLVDSIGNAFIVVSGLNEKMEDNTPEYLAFHLVGMKYNDSTWHQWYLNFPDTYLNSPEMEVDRANGRLVVTALYSLESNHKSMGILDFSLLTRDFKVSYHNFIPYNLDFVQEMIGEKAAQRGDEISDFIIRRVVTRTDGGYMVIGEEFFVSQQSYTYYINGIAQVSSRSVFNYGKIFVLSVDGQGKLEWTKVINKGQATVNDMGHYSSFTTMVRKEKVLFLFNDKLRGLGDVLLFSIDNRGRLENEMLFKNLNAYVSIIPREAEQIDINTLLIPTSKDRKFAFVKISF